MRATCAWCHNPIRASARRDAETCSQRCRQARHRTRVAARAGCDGTRTVPPISARRFAYADPPYPGNARLYRGHPDYAGEVDHDELLSRLTSYDGWALSTSARALPAVLALAVARGLDVRVAAWIRGPRPHATARYALNAWEPVIYAPVALAGERDPSAGAGAEPSRGARGTGDRSHAAAAVSEVSRGPGARRVDVLQHGIAPMTALPGRIIGTKPPAFCAWMFDLIGARRGDSLDDLYPGSGIVGRTWQARQVDDLALIPERNCS